VISNTIEEEPQRNVDDVEQDIEKVTELLTHLRIISLNVVECILRWREHLLHIYK